MPLSSMPVTPNQDAYIYSLRVSTRHVLVCLFPLPVVSEAPKEAPVRKYLPSSVYLEEKTDEQKKDEVKRSSNTV